MSSPKASKFCRLWPRNSATRSRSRTT
jgi:hypothetical protein